MALSVAFLCLPGVAPAQNRAPAGVLERDQQSDEFALRLRQQQEAMELQRVDPEAARRLESQQLRQRQEQETLHSRQRLETSVSRSRSEGISPPQPAVTGAQSQIQARERQQMLDRAERESGEVIRESKERRAVEDAPSWAPTLDR